MFEWLLALTGISGAIGLAVLAIVGGPILPTLAKIADAIFTPIATAVGNYAGAVLKMELDGSLDILQSGQRILFAVTLCVVTWSVAQHHTWQQVHSQWTLLPKAQSLTLRPMCRPGHMTNCRR